MSDPLTALMHAVQVMNLLKTLITKTLREREETATNGGYSPMSSCSSDRHTADEDFESQNEMDTSSETRGHASDYDENANYSHGSEDEDEDNDDGEVQSLSEIEKCFLRQLDDKKAVNITSSPDQSASDSQENNANSPQCCSGWSKMEESGVSFTDSKEGISGLTTSEGEEEDSSKSLISLQKRVDDKEGSSNMKDIHMDRLLVGENNIHRVPFAFGE